MKANYQSRDCHYRKLTNSQSLDIPYQNHTWSWYQALLFMKTHSSKLHLHHARRRSTKRYSLSHNTLLIKPHSSLPLRHSQLWRRVASRKIRNLSTSLPSTTVSTGHRYHTCSFRYPTRYNGIDNIICNGTHRGPSTPNFGWSQCSRWHENSRPSWNIWRIQRNWCSRHTDHRLGCCKSPTSVRLIRPRPPTRTLSTSILFTRKFKKARRWLHIQRGPQRWQWRGRKMSINISDISRCFRTIGNPMSYGYRSIRDRKFGSLISIWRRQRLLCILEYVSGYFRESDLVSRLGP